MIGEYELVRSARRTLSVEVTEDCRVLVRAPNRCTDREINTFLTQRAQWIEGALQRQEKRAQRHPRLSEGEETALRARAGAEIPPRVEYYARLMGLAPTGVKITGARTRFGSCSPNNSLCFSWRLMEYPAEAVDYVVVHELSHLVHKNHSREFYALVESVLPDYKKRKSLLKY